MGRISRELLRIAQERVIYCERELDRLDPSERDTWLRRDLEKRLREARESVAFKSEMVRKEDNVG